MYWRLNPALHACIASGRVILLDVERDRYSAVPAQVAGKIIAWLKSGDGSAAPHGLIALLQGARGGAPINELSNQHPTHVAVPVSISTREWAGGTTLMAVLSVIVAVGSTWIDLRTRPLRRILRSRTRVRANGGRLSASVLQDRARAFVNARPWCPIRPNCLLDSLAFDRWLGSPCDISLVFGVVGQPFEAHCWVQSDAAVLNDSYDRVSRFEPVLSV